MTQTTAQAQNMDETLWEDRKAQASAWFRQIRDEICAAFEKMEDDLSGGPKATMDAGRFERKPWERADAGENSAGSTLKGGGEISLMRGRARARFHLRTIDGSFVGKQEGDGADPQRRQQQVVVAVGDLEVVEIDRAGRRLIGGCISALRSCPPGPRRCWWCRNGAGSR